MRDYEFTIVIETDEEGRFVGSCPALPGCFSEADTPEQLRLNMQEAIASYIASCQKHGDPVPESDIVTDKVRVSA